MFGGVVADAVPKRVALAGAYLGMGALSLLIVAFVGSDFRSLLAILFVVRMLSQVAQPSEASAVPLVATGEELASATSFLSFVSSAGDVVGKALLAPLIVRAFGLTPLTVLAGLLFLLSATRVFDLRPPLHPGPVQDAPKVSTLAVIRWLLGERAQLWMLLLAALASTTGVIVSMLGPKYTEEVLGVDPANALYVFAPAVIGVLVALVAAPVLIRLLGERVVAAVGFAFVAVALSALGFVDQLRERVPWFPVVNLPLVGDRVELAAELSIFIGLGITLAAAATQIYISRTVPLGIQGRAFALLGTIRDGMAIVPLLALGAIAGVVGVRAVIVVAPLVLILLALGVDRVSARWLEPESIER